MTRAIDAARADGSGTRTAGAALLACGAAILAVGIWGLRRDVEWIAQPFYVPAWWGSILVLDGFTALRRGDSLLTRRRRLVPFIGLWSVTFWVFFELLNLRFQNWYYVGVIPVSSLAGAAGGGVFVVLCFSTVFIGIFEMYEALTATGMLRRWRGRPRPLSPWTSFAFQALGAAMALAAIVFPTYLAPLIWGSFTFLVDPWNYRHGARSLLADLERREWGRIARLFLAGLLCGLLWESLNFFAPQKWIYTVRGLENLKLFEMPLLGFFGFPALALDTFAAYALVSYLFLGNASWEHPADAPEPARRAVAPRQPLGLRGTLLTLPLHAVFWAAVAAAVDQVNVGSVALRLDDLPYLERSAIDVLEARGIRRPRQLVRAARGKGGDRLREALGLDEAAFHALLDATELFAFKGIGAAYGTALLDLGVRSIDDLAPLDPASLHARISERCRRLWIRPPRLDMVRVWVLAARSRGVIQRAG